MVYITSDLFGPTTTHDWEHHNSANHWPSMANEQHAAGLGKRKRQAGDEGPPIYEGNTLVGGTPNADAIARNLTRQQRSSPNRETTRLQFHNTPPFVNNGNLSYAVFPARANEYTSERRPMKQLKRLSPKATLVKSTSHLMDIDTHSHAVSDLRPCHACKLAPKRRKDLENYLDCRRCEGRTCYICARQCVGGCRKAICKKCIVEVGQEGEAWCLDCYSRNINA
jgi:hypothetical protein